MQNDLLEVALLVTNVFEALNVPYFITGSLASTLYGMVRSTQDVDIVAAMRREHVQRFVSAVRDAFYVDEVMIAVAVERGTGFNIIHRETFFKVDIFIASSRPFTREQLNHAKRLTFALESEAAARFATPEDTILAKLEWYRLGGEASDRQWRDILGVLKTRAGDLDLGYMHRWAAELEVEDLLERALREA